MKRLALLILLASFSAALRAQPAAAPAAPLAAPASAQSKAFAQLADDFWATRMRLSPLDATYNNYPGYNDRLDDNSAAGRAAALKAWTDLSKHLKAIDAKKLTESERLSSEIMRWELDLALEYDQHKFYQWNVDHIDGPQAMIPTIIAQAQPMATAADAEALLARMRAMKPYFANQIANLREGVKQKRVAARVPVEKTITQILDILKTSPDQSPYVTAANKLPPDLKAKYLPVISNAVLADAYVAERDYLGFLRLEYLPLTRREKIGVSDLPGGKAAYRFAIRQQTTVDKSPEELHAIGLQELEQIHGEMRAIAAKMGYKNVDLKAFLETVRKDRSNYFTSRAEVLKAAEEFVGRARAKLPAYFGLLPKTQVVVKPVEDYREQNDAAAEYYPPPDDLSRPGIYYVNTYAPETRTRFDVASTAAHEAVPGHHLQLAIATERRDLPTFQRHTDLNSYVEGWALYCERLADEMGLYATDLERFGMLANQSLRAARLVVDTGLHAMSWKREQAIAFMLENTPLSKEEIETEVDRYTVWPGQALGYKVGQREITSLRADVKAKLGASFDIRAFHDAVLKNGSLPLPLMRRVVTEALVKH